MVACRALLLCPENREFQVSFLASLTVLTELILAGNPMTAEEDYRGRALATLPSLTALDHT